MDGRSRSSERRSTTGGSDCATRQRCSNARGHPGVVALVDIDDGDEATTLSTAWLGGGSLASAEMAPKKLAGVGAMLAMTIADLHDRAIAHRRITSDHVLLDGLGRVVLVGFGDASASPGECETADDVAAIGVALEAKLPTDLAAIARRCARARQSARSSSGSALSSPGHATPSPHDGRRLGPCRAC